MGRDSAGEDAALVCGEIVVLHAEAWSCPPLTAMRSGLSDMFLFQSEVPGPMRDQSLSFNLLPLKSSVNLSFHTTGAVAAPLDFWGAGFAAKHAEAHASAVIAAHIVSVFLMRKIIS